MKIFAWNVNSVRARLDRLVDWLKSTQPDVVCLQELKCQDTEFPKEAVLEAGYHAAVHGQKTYNGVAILAKTEPTDVVRGLSDGVDDTHARLIAATVNGVRVVSAYAPNGQSVGSEQYEYKLQWYGRLRRYLEARHRPDEPLVLCGDWNVAPEDIDVWDPAAFEGATHVTAPEREALADLRGWGLVDVFRRRYPDVEGLFSYWDYTAGRFHKRQGMRIDYVLATEALAEVSTMDLVDRNARKGTKPSDHAPVIAEFARADRG